MGMTGIRHVTGQCPERPPRTEWILVGQGRISAGRPAAGRCQQTQSRQYVPPVCCSWGILPPSWEHCRQLWTVISERPWGWNGQRYRRRPTDRTGPGHRCDLGQPCWSCHYLCWPQLFSPNGMGGKRLANRQQALFADVLWESAIDHFLNNFWQKAEVVDGSIQHQIVEIHGVLLQQWSDNGISTAAWGPTHSFAAIGRWKFWGARIPTNWNRFEQISLNFNTWPNMRIS